MLKRLASDTVIYGLGTIVPRLINYLLAPYLTYLALSEESYGVMSYFYATIPFGLSILTMGLENAFFRFTGKAETAIEKLRVFKTTTTTVLLFSLLFLAAAIYYQDRIYELIDYDFSSTIIPLVVGIIAIDAVSAIPFARLRDKGKSLQFSILKIVGVLINVSFVVFFYSYLPSHNSGILAPLWVEDFGSGYVFVSNLIASGVILVVLMAMNLDYRPIIEVRLLKQIMIFSIPLFISGFSGTANEFIDRQMMAFLLPQNISMEEIGTYSATLKIAALMIIFTQMYRYAAEPLFLSKTKRENFKEDTALATKYFYIASLAIFLVITLFIDLFEMLVAEDFRDGVALVPVMLISNILLGLQLNLSFWYKFRERTHYALYITLAGLVVIVLFNYIFLPQWGYSAAAYAKLLGMATMVAISYWLNQKHYPIDYQLPRLGLYTALTAILYFSSEAITLDNIWLDNIARLALLGVFVAFVVKLEIKKNIYTK